MKKVKVAMIEANFVVYEGKGPPCAHTTGQYCSYPILVNEWHPLAATPMLPAHCVRFHFLTLQIRETEFGQITDGKLGRMANQSDIVARSGDYYVGCIQLTAQQACYRRNRPRGLMVPTMGSINCWSDAVDVSAGDKNAVLGYEGWLHVIDPERDHVWSTREPRPNEFRMIA